MEISHNKARKFASKFKSRRGVQSGSAGSILGSLLAIGIGIYFFAYFTIPSMVALAGANVTGLSTAVTALIAIVNIVAILGAIILFLRSAGLRIGLV